MTPDTESYAASLEARIDLLENENARLRRNMGIAAMLLGRFVDEAADHIEQMDAAGVVEPV